jgi:hypothetical protein
MEINQEIDKISSEENEKVGVKSVERAPVQQMQMINTRK